MPQGEKNRETYHDGNISWHTYLIAFFFHSITTPRRTCVLQESPFSNVHKQWFVIYDDFLPVVVVVTVTVVTDAGASEVANADSESLSGSNDIN